MPSSAISMFSAGTPVCDREVGVGDQVAGLAVHRHHVPRPQDVVAVQQLAGGGVARRRAPWRCPCARRSRPSSRQAVDHAVHRVLVARDQRGGQDDGVALAHLDRVVAGWPCGTARPSARPANRWTSARSCRRAARPRSSMSTSMPGGIVQVAELRGDAHVADHRAADERHLAAVAPAASRTCCTRCMWEEKLGDDDALRARPNTPSSTGPMSFSAG